MWHFTANALFESLQAIEAKTSYELFLLLKQRHTEPTRYYHCDRHVSECLNHFKQYSTLADNDAEIEVAFWFHDAVYDVRRNDNEEQSAKLAQEQLRILDTPEKSIDRITNMILATKSHEPKSQDEAIVVDVDLGILGASPDAFERYDSAIRKEYDWVPEAKYRLARADVLAGFLRRTQIYHTDVIREALESQARHNLVKKIAELRG